MDSHRDSELAEKAIFAPDEDIIIPEILKQKPPRKLWKNVFRETFDWLLISILILLIPSLLFWAAIYFLGPGNFFSLFLCLFLIVIVAWRLKHLLENLISFWLQVSGTVAIAVVTKTRHVEIDASRWDFYADYTYTLPNGTAIKRSRRYLSRSRELGDRFIILYCPRFPKIHTRYPSEERFLTI
jgi:hypothetical protein